MKIFFCATLLLLSVHSLQAQGCSDAGFCTAGDFNSQHKSSASGISYKNELDITFNYASHGKNERFYQPQLNYRFIKKNRAFFEFRLPLSTAKNTSSGVSTTGIGDILATYNHRFSVSKKNKIDYSVGFRVSLSDASKKAGNATASYPMYLQTGLGTTDFIAVANYDIIKYISIGAGLQLPLFQYNNNKAIFSNSTGTGFITGEGYRRKPDALLKLTGHYQLGKLKINGTVLNIFHLADDYYNTSNGKYSLTQSKGSTINLALDLSYAAGKKITLGILYASPYKTRKNIPDGLARSVVISPKLTIAF